METKVREIMSSVLDIPEAVITDNTTPENTKNWDSLAHINLVVALEEQFGVTFGEDHITNLISISAICNIIKELQSQSG